MPTKRCSQCKADKEYAEFSPASAGVLKLKSACKQCRTDGQKQRYAADPDKARAKDKARYEREADRRKAASREWYSANQRRAIVRSLAYCKRRRASDIEFRLRGVVSCGLRNRLRTGKNGRSWCELLGYSVDDLKQHLERQFLQGMSWANYGQWHIDHIIPLSSFTVSGPDDPELRRAWSLPNLRPLWAVDNFKKFSKRLTLL